MNGQKDWGCIYTLGKVDVKGIISAAKILETFFIVPAVGLPSKPSCAFSWKNKKQNIDSIPDEYNIEH